MSSSDLLVLPDRIRTIVEGELQPEERLDWIGQPIPGRLARKAIPIVLFGIPWTAFSVFWMVMASQGISRSGGPGLLFPLFGLPFVLIGLGLLSSPFWIRRSASRSAYVLTDRRAIVVKQELWGNISVRSFTAPALGDLIRRESSDGSGDLVFTQDVVSGSRGRHHATEVGFLAVQDVKRVEGMVRELALRTGKSG